MSDSRPGLFVGADEPADVIAAGIQVVAGETTVLDVGAAK